MDYFIISGESSWQKWWLAYTEVDEVHHFQNNKESLNTALPTKTIGANFEFDHSDGIDDINVADTYNNDNGHKKMKSSTKNVTYDSITTRRQTSSTNPQSMMLSWVNGGDRSHFRIDQTHIKVAER